MSKTDTSTETTTVSSDQSLAELNGGIAQDARLGQVGAGSCEQRRPLSQPRLCGERRAHPPRQHAKNKYRPDDNRAA